MSRHRRERGSAYLYVAAGATLMGTVLVAIIPLATQARTSQTRRTLKDRMVMTGEALIAQVRADAAIGPIANGSTRTLTMNGVTATATLTDSSATISNSVFVSGTASINDQTIRFSRYVGKSKALTPFSYAIYSDSDINHWGKLITGSGAADGDVFSNAKIALTAPGTAINGDVSAKDSISLASDATVTGTRNAGATSVAFPTLTGLNYTLASSYTSLSTASSTSGLTFGAEVNGHYQIYCYGGDLSLQGPISGNGVVYVAGNLYVTGNLSYASSTNKVAFLVGGQLIFRSGCSSAVGIYYVKDQLISESADLTISRGIIAARKITSGASIRVTRDNAVRDDSSEGVKLCLPGYWP